jgi:Uma2 family endonuclease
MTVAEYSKIPEPKEGHLELHHGEVVSVPPPKWRHQILQDRISTLLKAQMGGSGTVLCEMAFRPAPEYEVWQADVGYVRADRAARTSEDEYLTGAPELVVEVLSPRNTVDEIDEKRTICLDNGCLSFWVVNDRRKLVSVTEGNVTKHYGRLSKIVCTLLPEELPVEHILA